LALPSLTESFKRLQTLFMSADAPILKSDCGFAQIQ
jgi:hypothetical protein